jgi:hypothetical protein
MADELKLTPVLEAERKLVEQVIQVWRSKRAARLEANRVMEKLKDEESMYASWLQEVFRQQKLEGMLIDGRLTGLTPTETPVVSDKEAFQKYILENKALDLLQFRLSVAAVNERKENGVKVPGTEYIPIYALFDKKVK